MCRIPWAAARSWYLSTAKATELTDTTGTKYVMDNDTGVYYNGKESVWSEVYSWLNAGTSLTLYLDAGGGVDYVFVGGGGTTSNAGGHHL